MKKKIRWGQSFVHTIKVKLLDMCKILAWWVSPKFNESEKNFNKFVIMV